MFFLGVDGGGTKTSFTVALKTGHVVAETTTGTCDLTQVTREQVFSTFKNALDCLNQRVPFDPRSLTYSIWGLSGFGENVAHSELVQELITTIVGSQNYLCVNDAEVGWAGSLACRPGIHLVAGTGAIGFGKNSKGITARASGWSQVFGDEGSAYWLGRELLQVFSKQADGRLPKTSLYDLLRQTFGLVRDLDLIELVFSQSNRASIAQIASLGYEAALLGDPSAKELYERGAYEHSLTIKALIRELDFSELEVIPVSYNGGVFKAGEFILKPLRGFLEDSNVDLQKPILSPARGACLLAIDKSGTPWDDSIVKTLGL